MTHETIRCPVCGLEAQSASTGSRGTIDVNATEWVQLCQAPGPKGTVNPFECPHLKQATERQRRETRR